MEKDWSLSALIKMLSSVFFIGYSRFFPGTLASLAAFLIYIFLIRGNYALHLICVLTAVILGSWISGKAEKLFKRKDAPQIVIDDFSGMLAALLFLPYGLRIGWLGFIVFRLFDVFKPYPISKIEKLSGSWGVMGDDLLAALYTNITLQLFLKLTCA